MLGGNQGGIKGHREQLPAFLSVFELEVDGQLTCLEVCGDTRQRLDVSSALLRHFTPDGDAPNWACEILGRGGCGRDRRGRRGQRGRGWHRRGWRRRGWSRRGWSLRRDLAAQHRHQKHECAYGCQAAAHHRTNTSSMTRASVIGTPSCK